jgi:hypothetical protein
MVTVDGRHCDTAPVAWLRVTLSRYHARQADFSDSVKRLRFKPSPEFPDLEHRLRNQRSTAENVEHDQRHRSALLPIVSALCIIEGEAPGLTGSAPQMRPTNALH